jgi:pentatricopeptide repeat protein
LQLLSNELSDTVSYNSAITACGNAGRWQHALALFDEMPRKADKS